MCETIQIHCSHNPLAAVNCTNKLLNAIIDPHQKTKSYKKKDPFKRIR